MSQICFISLGTRPFLHIDFICEVIGVVRDKWLKWAFHPMEHSIAMVRTPNGMYFEESGASLLVERFCTKELYYDWKKHITRKNAKRKLTESEKKAVAAEANYTCQMCKERVKDYEIDHIEQHALRGNDDRSNLQCLCANCHREKTRNDRHFGDALFEKRLKLNSTHLHGKDGNIFSSYFHTK